jgi:hypothetical protein
MAPYHVPLISASEQTAKEEVCQAISNQSSCHKLAHGPGNTAKDFGRHKVKVKCPCTCREGTQGKYVRCNYTHT